MNSFSQDCCGLSKLAVKTLVFSNSKNRVSGGAEYIHRTNNEYYEVEIGEFVFSPFARGFLSANGPGWLASRLTFMASRLITGIVETVGKAWVWVTGHI